MAEITITYQDNKEAIALHKEKTLLSLQASIFQQFGLKMGGYQEYHGEIGFYGCYLLSLKSFLKFFTKYSRIGKIRNQGCNDGCFELSLFSSASKQYLSLIIELAKALVKLTDIHTVIIWADTQKIIIKQGENL